MTNILKIDAVYEMVVVRFQLFPKSRRSGSAIVSRIIEAVISDTMSIDTSVPQKWIYDSSLALEKEGHKVEYFEIRYGGGKVSMAAFTSGRLSISLDGRSGKVLKIKKLVDRIKHVQITHPEAKDNSPVKL